MDLIQFRIHPSVGMARLGGSGDWYFLGPEIPRFIQEQFDRLRHTPRPLRHPARAHPDAEADTLKPDAGHYRDKGGLIMPQAARFRVFAYVYSRGASEPYKVMELKPDHADIEWTVKLANEKTVKAAGGLDPNEPLAQPLSTKASSPPTNCQSGTLPNLAWLALEQSPSDSSLTGRLHVIGNEGTAQGGALVNFPTPFLYQDDWYDPAADGPVTAVVELKPAFKALFPGFRYLAPGQKNPIDLPTDNKIAALGAWVVVNVPDYVPDMGHIVSLWDLALNQAWKYVADGKAKAVDGQHYLAVAKTEVHSYVFYDFYTHIYPQLRVFSDLAYVSGQARAGTNDTTQYTGGIALSGQLTAKALDTDPSISIPADEAVRIKVASLGQSFMVVLSASATNPFHGSNELVRCTVVGDGGILTVDRGQDATTPAIWPLGTHYFATTKAAFLETKLLEAIGPGATKINVALQAAHTMPEPTAAGPNARDNSFKIALSKPGKLEWIECTLNRKTKGELTVTRGRDGTAASDWSKGDTVIAAALGHKKLDARARATALATGLGGPIPLQLFNRLRLPKNVYERKYKKLPTLADSELKPYPREFGRRLDIGAIDPRATHSGRVNVTPDGSASRFHELFTRRRKKACNGEPLTLDDPVHKPLPAGDTEAHVTELNDYYWIVSERDMPLQKETAYTHIQYNQFEYWATGKMEKGHYTRWAPLFEVILKGSSLDTFFNEAHEMEEYIDRLLTKRPLYAPAFLDMASLGKMLGGSFLPGIEVGREGGKPTNWSLYRGGTVYFPDVRFHPQGKAGAHPAGTLTKDLAIPWFADYIGCEEDFWPTSRPQVVYQKNGLGYSWLSKAQHTTTEAAFKIYWTRLGFIRRGTSGELFEQEATFDRP